MMNAANMEGMSPLTIDFQLWSSGKYYHPRQQMHIELRPFFFIITIDHMAKDSGVFFAHREIIC